MAVFLAASDETLGGTHRSAFRRCGFLAPLKDWESLTEQWDARVLAGPPRIPYLHMVEIRRPEWRAAVGIDADDANRRVDEAFALIASTPSLVPIGFGLNSGHLYDNFTKPITLASGANKDFVPDYVAFPAYVFMVLRFCNLYRPDAEKVDFYIERNGEITDHLKEFYKGLPASFEYIGQPQLTPLMGDILLLGKDPVPLQAADVLCWHTRRFNEGTLKGKELERYADIAGRAGTQFNAENSYLNELWESFHQEKPGISEFLSSNDHDTPSRSNSGESCDGTGEKS